MNFIKETIEYIRQLLTWWVEVMPWEQGIRVTLGKKQTLVKSGIWIKFPIIHTVYVVQTRLRVMDTPVQTVSTTDDITISVRIIIGYQINDVIKLYASMNDPVMTISNAAQAIVSEVISEHSSKELTQKLIQSSVPNYLSTMNWGISFEMVGVTNFAKTKPYRLMGDSYWSTSDSNVNDNNKKP